MNALKFHVRKLLGLPVHYYLTPARIPSSSHQPVLAAIAKLFPIKRVLELGSGEFSTAAFLNRKLFPHVEHVLSIETNPDWKQHVEQFIGPDSRLQIALVDSDIRKNAANFDYPAFDVVFVDSGTTPTERATMIEEVAKRHHESNLVVCHDFENALYQKVAAAFPNGLIFDALRPYTAVFWRNGRIDKVTLLKLKRLKKQIARHAGKTEPDEIDAWIEIIADAAKSL
jgi:hypothetical protein